MSVELTAPVVAVTVYPQGARVTRRGRVDLAAGATRIRLADVPDGIDADSVRVGGTGGFAVHGVDVGVRRRAETADPVLAELEARRVGLRTHKQELADSIDVEESGLVFLDGLADHAGASFARRLAGGHGADPAAFAADLAAQRLATKARIRSLRVDLERDDRAIAAVERELADRARSSAPDTLAVTIDVGAANAGAVDLEVEYVVHSAGWHSTYDVRYADDGLEVTWFALITQRSGEDWPECELALSTARVATSARVPELDPWFLERVRPTPPPRARVDATFAAKMHAAEAFTMAAPDAATNVVAAVEHGMTAATYRPVRNVAVPADGEAHRATIAVLATAAELDYIAAPVIAPEVYLRATAVNSSEHTLSPGRASIYNGSDFVGVTQLELWAPGEEVELALGIDDRVRVERKLERQTAGRGFTANRRAAAYRIDVANHSPRDARITVLDQVPVSRDEAISVKDVRTEPRPESVSDLGEVTWEFTLEPGGRTKLTLAFRVDIGKGVELRNWRE